MATVVLGNAEKCFIVHGVQDDFRTDGRSCEDYRTISLETDVIVSTNGSAKLRIGNTELIVGVKVELGKPKSQVPNEGWIEFHVDCSPNANPLFQGKGGKSVSDNICSILTRIYSNNSVVDLNSLSIIPNEQCWVLHVDVLILECGGNLLDAASIAVKVGLQKTGIPNVTVSTGDEGEQEINLPDDPYDARYINTNNCPILVTLSKIGNRHIVDATAQEENCCNASIVMGVTRRGRSVGIRKQGLGSLEPESVSEMIESGKKVGRQLHVAVDKFLKASKG